MPDVYGGKYRDDKYSADELVQLYSDEVQQCVEKSAANGKGVSCFIAESLQSCGGQIILPPDYLRKVYKYEVLLILNFPVKVQAYFYIEQECQRRRRCVHRRRSPSWLRQSWNSLVGVPVARRGYLSRYCNHGCCVYVVGSSLQSCYNELVNYTGQPMGNGHPIAAVITTKEIADSFAATGMEYFNTVRHLTDKTNFVLLIHLLRAVWR